ncbi:MAG: leucine-rich repeat domain-containing protein [Holosporales bacterium]|nr:leucine-rich repeat domain-containing protein [Holosporales bacterium]
MIPPDTNLHLYVVPVSCISNDIAVWYYKHYGSERGINSILLHALVAIDPNSGRLQGRRDLGRFVPRAITLAITCQAEDITPTSLVIIVGFTFSACHISENPGLLPQGAIPVQAILERMSDEDTFSQEQIVAQPVESFDSSLEWHVTDSSFTPRNRIYANGDMYEVLAVFGQTISRTRTRIVMPFGVKSFCFDNLDRLIGFEFPYSCKSPDEPTTDDAPAAGAICRETVNVGECVDAFGCTFMNIRCLDLSVCYVPPSIKVFSVGGSCDDLIIDYSTSILNCKKAPSASRYFFGRDLSEGDLHTWKILAISGLGAPLWFAKQLVRGRLGYLLGHDYSNVNYGDCLDRFCTSGPAVCFENSETGVELVLQYGQSGDVFYEVCFTDNQVIGRDCIQFRVFASVTCHSQLEPGALRYSEIGQLLVYSRDISEDCCYWSEFEEVHLFDTVINLGASAFFSTHLSRITIPWSVANIGPSCFQQSKIEEVVCEDGPDSASRLVIHEHAFAQTPLSEIVLSIRTTRLETKVFSGCASLRSVSIAEVAAEAGMAVIPAGVCYIGPDCFHETGFTTVIFEQGAQLETIYCSSFDKGIQAIGDENAVHLLNEARWQERLMETER